MRRTSLGFTTAGLLVSAAIGAATVLAISRAVLQTTRLLGDLDISLSATYQADELKRLLAKDFVRAYQPRTGELNEPVESIATTGFGVQSCGGIRVTRRLPDESLEQITYTTRCVASTTPPFGATAIFPCTNSGTQPLIHIERTALSPGGGNHVALFPINHGSSAMAGFLCIDLQSTSNANIRLQMNRQKNLEFVLTRNVLGNLEYQ